MTERAGLAGRALYLRLLHYVRPYRREFALAVLAMVALAASEPLLPALLGPLLDGSFAEQPARAAPVRVLGLELGVRLIPVLIIALFLVRGVLSYVGRVAMQWVANRVVMDLRARMFSRLVMLPAPFYDRHSTGGLISKLTFDVAQVSTAATKALTVVLEDSIRILALVGFMFYVNWKLALIVLALSPPIGWVVVSISARLREMSRRVQHSMGDITHVAEEAIKGQQEVKIFAGQRHEIERFGRAINDARKYAMKVVMASAANVPLIQLIIAIGLSALVWIATGEARAGRMTVGDFVAFFTAMTMLLAPTKRLTGINEHLQRGLAAAESVFSLIDEREEAGTGRHIDRPAGALAFRGVRFTYPGAGAPALDGVDLEVAAGETLALVGPSGSGKSTLVNMVPRFYRPDAGVVEIDGVDVAEIDLEDLRANIALVSQHVVLFNDTLRNNIAYGALRPSPAEAVTAAAEAAHVSEFARELPQGLDTPIGEGGVRLSGGQRQRLAIARALVKDAPILILDEATSSLDSAAERHIQAALERLRRGRTCLVVAHRLSTVESADRIAVLEGGRVVEAGTHGELMRRQGLYTELHRLQFRERAGGAAGPTAS